MPYITDHEKQRLESQNPESPGQLTYVLQQTLQRYIKTRGLSYATLAECLGALAGTEHDLVRRVVTPYEERKQRENGDVWESPIASGGT